MKMYHGSCVESEVLILVKREDFHLVPQLKTKVNTIHADIWKERAVTKYKMPQRYVDAIQAIVETRPTAKPSEVEGLILHCLGVEGGE